MEETNNILDEHKQQFIAAGKLPVIITVIPKMLVYTVLRELAQQEILVRTGQARRGESLLSSLEKMPQEGFFYTLLIGKTDDDDDNCVTLLKETPV